MVKPRPAAEEKSEKEGGILEELGLERGRDEPLSLVEELKRGTVTLRRVQPDFERKTVCTKMISWFQTLLKSSQEIPIISSPPPSVNFKERIYNCLIYQMSPRCKITTSMGCLGTHLLGSGRSKSCPSPHFPILFCLYFVPKKTQEEIISVSS